MTLSITTFSIATLSITIKSATPSIMILDAENVNAECPVFNVMLGDVVLNAIMLSVVAPIIRHKI